jgi:purine-nucleoside/S-methyl-5'-thioadenosine phosphorylase / adenosine deaminase
VTRSKPFSPSQTEQNLKDIDKTLSLAGLVRNRRTTPAGITSRLRSARREATSKEELVGAVPETGRSGNGVELLQIRRWLQNKDLKDWLWHGFSTRHGGVSHAYSVEGAPGELNLGFTAADSREAVEQNRRLFAEAVTGKAETPIAGLRQFHSNLIVIADKTDASKSPKKADGVISAVPGLLVGIQTADCIPVLVADRRQRVVAAFHAGWRGTVKRIVELGVGRMRLEFGCRPEDLIAAIGPGAAQCCYSVGEELLSEFESQFSYARELFREVFDSDPVRTKYPMLFLTQRAPGHSPIGPQVHLDLIEANRRQLLDAGLNASAIGTTGGCTHCHSDLFFSHRASRGHAGRMMSVIGIKG